MPCLIMSRIMFVGQSALIIAIEAANWPLVEGYFATVRERIVQQLQLGISDTKEFFRSWSLFLPILFQFLVCLIKALFRTPEFSTLRF